jgi:hypothetical protein
VFVNFIPVADITLLSPELFRNIKREAIRVAGILYAPPTYLRMAMYLELSRPDGDISRWEKVLKRITLLNKHYPLIGKKCREVDFQRAMENDNEQETVYETVKNTLIDEGVVFFGGLANTLYSRYMPTKISVKFRKLPDFDVLSEDCELTASLVKERLEQTGFKSVKIIKHDKIGEIISEHVEIRVGQETICFIYTPLACHSYNSIQINNKTINVATIDTMLSFYLAFVYADRKYYDRNRILCMSQYLFIVQQKNRLAQKGLLKRFSINCYGKQETLETMRSEKAEKFNELKGKRDSKEYLEWFLRYVPRDNQKLRQRKSVISARKRVNRPITERVKTLKNKAANKNKTISIPLKTVKRKATKKRKHKSSKRFFGLF